MKEKNVLTFGSNPPSKGPEGPFLEMGDMSRQKFFPKKNFHGPFPFPPHGPRPSGGFGSSMSEKQDLKEALIEKKILPNNTTLEESEDEKKLKEAHLKKYTKRQILVKSLIFGLRNWKYDAYTQITKIINKFIDLQIPLLNSEIINAITEDKDLIILYAKFKKFLYFLLFRFAFNSLGVLFAIFFIRSSLYGYKNIVLENIAIKDIEFFDIFKTGEVIERIKQNEESMSKNFLFLTLNMLTEIFQFLFVIQKLFSISRKLSIIYIVCYALKFTADYFIKKYTEFARWRERIKKNDRYSAALTEFISNIRLVKSFGTEKQELKKLSTLKEQTYWPQFELQNILFQIMDLINRFIDALILYEAGKETILGKMAYGSLVIFQSYSHQIRQSYYTIQNTFEQYVEIFNNWQRFFEIYDYEPKILSQKNIVPKELKGDLEFKNVEFSYPLTPEVKIFNGLSFKIESGKVVAIVGHSGSGKTTISNLIQRFYDPSNGAIYMDNYDLKDLNLDYLHQQIGFVAQEPVLNSGTIEENIIYGVTMYSQTQLDEVCDLANLGFIKDKNLFPKGMKTLVGERGTKVSGGQKQRIAIARALMKNVKYLVFDEATSALDAESEGEVQSAIDNIVKQKRITTIIIAHRLSTIKNADVIMFLKKGEIAEMGTHKELLEKNGEYKKLIEKQLESV